MTEMAKSVSAKAMIVPPDSEQLLWQNEVEIWSSSKGGPEKTKKMVELFTKGSLENDPLFLAIKDMCISGKIFHPNTITKFQEHLQKDLTDIYIAWLADCIETITYICNNDKKIYKLLQEGLSKGNFSFKVETKGYKFQFANVLMILGLGTIDDSRRKTRCDMTNNGSCSGIEIFKEILGKSDLSFKKPPNLIENGAVSDAMVSVDASTHVSLLSVSKHNSDNKKTTGSNSPIGDNNKVEKTNVNSEKKEGLFKDKVLPAILISLLMLVGGIIWAIIRGHTLNDIGNSLDSKAGLEIRTTPTNLPTPTITIIPTTGK